MFSIVPDKRISYSDVVRRIRSAVVYVVFRVWCRHLLPLVQRWWYFERHKFDRRHFPEIWNIPNFPANQSQMFASRARTFVLNWKKYTKHCSVNEISNPRPPILPHFPIYFILLKSAILFFAVEKYGLIVRGSYTPISWESIYLSTTKNSRFVHTTFAQASTWRYWLV